MKRWIKSLNFAIEGILHSARTQRHVRFHLIISVFLLFFSFILGVKGMDIILLTIVASLVIVAEMINSAIEVTIDIISPEKNELARIAKDTAAGAVLVASCVAGIVGYVLLKPYVFSIINKGYHLPQHRADVLVVGAIIIVLIFVIFLKALFGAGHPLRGGMPSGHTALAFSLWVSLSFITKNYIVSIATFVSAYVIAHSRLLLKIHTIKEVLAGFLLGSVITFIIFILFYGGI